MYKIYADGTLIYDSTLEDYTIGSGEISKETNKSGSFTFLLYPDSPFYNRIEKLKTIIEVYKRDYLEFRGRVIKEDIGFYNDKIFTCEGELSFFLDSIQRPYDVNGTPAEVFAFLVNNHNSQVSEDKRFILGEVTVTDNNDYIHRSNSNYEDTLTNIMDHLIDLEGGYLHITRNENNQPVINWYADYPYLSNQEIKFGENLLDFTRTNSGETIGTAIIPLGANLDNEDGEGQSRVTIESVNDGVDYIYDQKAVDVYGLIYKVVTWDEVTEPANLLTKAKSYLSESINQNITIELSAVDLSLMDKSIDNFKLGDYIRIVSEPHNMDDRLLLKKQTIDLLNPEQDTITLGYTYSTFTDESVSNKNQNNTLNKKIEIIEGNYAPNKVVTEEIETLRTLINQTSVEISTLVSSQYVSNDALVTELSTLYTQLNDSFEFMFTQLETTVNDNDNATREEFTEIQKYIRFVDGNILLGESGNELELKIQNDRISFLQEGVEVAYFSNRKMYVTDGEFLNSLTLGKFAFIPRINGNLSFKKVG